MSHLPESNCIAIDHEMPNDYRTVQKLRYFQTEPVPGSTVQYTDNGPGIPEEFIKDQSIFDPGFSTKSGGTGLGLAIAGEAAERNGCKLKAYHSESGARFVLELFPGLTTADNGTNS